MQIKSRLTVISASILAASMLISTASFAAANYKGEGNYKGETMAPVAPCNSLTLKDGFYVGLQGGYDSYRARRTESFTDSDGDRFASSNVQNATGFVGGLFAGYGKYFDNFYLGAEIFANGSGAEATNSFNSSNDGQNVSGSIKTTVGASYGVALLPGLKLNDSSLGYIRLGYNRANLKGQESFTDDGVTASTSKSNTQGGFNYGVGIETAIAQNVSLRGEYSHTDYGSFSNANAGSKYTFTDNQFMLGLNYHFS